MICLTGDLHHASLRTGNQQHCDRSEIEVAQLFVELLERHGVKVTFFVSGVAVEQEWADLQPILSHPLVEVGGHNYSCFQPELAHRAWNKLTGNYNGPLPYQIWDALRTRELLEQRLGREVVLWRNHMYMHGPNTELALARAGIRLCSDGVDRSVTFPRRHPTGIYNFPLNIIPDHEHLYHAERTPEWVARWQQRYGWSDDYGPDSYDIDEWAEIVLAGLREREAAGVIANMIIHPITMYLCDRFAAFRRILDYLAAHHSVHLGEVLALAEQRAQGAESGR